MTRRKRLDTISVTHPQTGEVLRVLPMDDWHFVVDIVPGRAWAVFNLRSGVKGGTRFGLTTVEGPAENDPSEEEI